MHALVKPVTDSIILDPSFFTQRATTTATRRTRGSRDGCMHARSRWLHAVRVVGRGWRRPRGQGWRLRRRKGRGGGFGGGFGDRARTHRRGSGCWCRSTCTNDSTSVAAPEARWCLGGIRASPRWQSDIPSTLLTLWLLTSVGGHPPRVLGAALTM